MNGLEVQERLASRGNRLPVIFITAYDEPGVRDRALAAGGGGVLPQPLHHESFITTLRHTLPYDNGPANTNIGGNNARERTVVRSGLLRLCSSQLVKIPDFMEWTKCPHSYIKENEFISERRSVCIYSA